MPKQKRNKTIYRKRKKTFNFLLKIIGVVFVLILLCGVITFIWFFKDLPRPEKFAEGEITQSTKIYDRTGEIILYEIFGEEKRTIIPFSSIPEHTKQAMIATEDKHFYEHKGVDLKGIARAILYDLKIRDVSQAQGASTISQQLIKNYFLTHNKTIKRKTRELILSLEMERRYSKDQILNWYLNLIPFGSYLYGVETASWAFFDKPVSDITIAESAILAALVKSPSALWPYGDNKDKLLARKDYVLNQMRKEAYITQEQYEQSKAEEITFVPIFNAMKAPHFIEFVKAYLEEKYGNSYLERNGLRVITTLDLDLQEKAEEIIKDNKNVLAYYNAHNAALTAIDPKTGELLAMVGSIDYFGESYPEECKPGVDCLFDPQVNVSLSKRQPGSSFKPFAYSIALKNGFTPETLIWDTFTEFNTNCAANGLQTYDKYKAKCYHPKNYDDRYVGQVSIRNALAQSRNLPAVKILYLAGIKPTLDFVKTLGISTLTDESRYGLALVLGGGEVKLLEITSAYSTFASDGTRSPVSFIQKIEDSDGSVLYRAKQSRLKVMSYQTARQINDILSDNTARAPLFGWNSMLHIPGYDVAVKTGTTQRYNDAWTIGYSPTIAVGVWVGNNNNESTTQPGVMLSGPIWNKFIKYALQKYPNEKFTKPKQETTDKPILNGISQGLHSILHFVNKNNPQGQGNSKDDEQYWHWENNIR